MIGCIHQGFLKMTMPFLVLQKILLLGVRFDQNHWIVSVRTNSGYSSFFNTMVLVTCMNVSLKPLDALHK